METKPIDWGSLFDPARTQAMPEPKPLVPQHSQDWGSVVQPAPPAKPKQYKDWGSVLAPAPKLPTYEPPKTAIDPYEEQHLLKGVWTLMGQVPSVVQDVIPLTIGRAIRGGDTDIDDSGMLDSWIEANKNERERRMTLTEEEREKTWFKVPFTDIKVKLGDAESAADSIGYSIVNAITSIGTKIAVTAGVTAGTGGNVVAGAVVGNVAGVAAGTVVSGRATKDQFIDDVQDMFMKAKGVSRITPQLEAEWSEFYEEINGDANWYGFWEAAPETVGNMLTLGIAKAGKGKLAGPLLAKIKAKIAAKVTSKIGKAAMKAGTTLGIGSAKLGAMLTEEAITETVTSHEQSKIEAKNGTRDKALTWEEAFLEVLPMILITTPIMGGGMAGASKLADKGNVLNNANQEATSETPDKVNRKEDALTILEQASERVAAQAAEAEAAMVVPEQQPAPLLTDADVAPGPSVVDGNIDTIIDDVLAAPDEDVQAVRPTYKERLESGELTPDQARIFHEEEFLSTPSARPEWSSQRSAVVDPKTELDYRINRELKVEASTALKSEMGESVTLQSEGVRQYKEFLDIESGKVNGTTHSEVYGEDFVKQVSPKDLNPVQKLWRQIGRRLYNRDVYFVEYNQKVKDDPYSNLEAKRGARIAGTGAIIIVKGDTIRNTGTLFHELTHDMNRTAAPLWKELTSFVMANVDNAALRETYDRLQKNYGDNQDIKIDELVAIFVGDIMMKGDAQVKLLKKLKLQDPTTFTKLITYIRQALQKLSQFLKQSKESEARLLAKDVDAAIEFVTNTLATFQKTTENPMVDPGRASASIAPSFDIQQMGKKEVKYYSQMNRYLEKVLPGKGGAKQYTALIKKWDEKGEFKSDELEWAGLIEWLNDPKTLEELNTEEEFSNLLKRHTTAIENRNLEEAEATRKKMADFSDTTKEKEKATTTAVFNKKAIMDYLEENEVSIEEIHKVEFKKADPDFDLPMAVESRMRSIIKIQGAFGSNPITLNRENEEFVSFTINATEEVIPLSSAYNVFVSMGASDQYATNLVSSIDSLIELDNRITAAQEETDPDTARQNWMDRLARLQETLYNEYGMYVGHGLVDGRLQIIEVRSVKDGSLVVPDKWAESKAAFKIVEEMKRADERINELEHVEPILPTQYGPSRSTKLNIGGGDGYSEMLLTLPKITPKFLHGHWKDTENVVAMVRFDFRIVDGKKVLLIQELQSDWHQKGRKYGYKGRPIQYGSRIEGYTPVGYTWEKEAKNGVVIHKLVNPDGKVVGKGTIKSEAAQRAGFRPDTMVPDAPFKKSWSDLAMKRMVKMAAEMGQDYLAWVPAEVIKERYNLTTVINSFVIDPEDMTVTAYDKHDNEVMREDTDGTVANIAEHIGDELAQKLVDKVSSWKYDREQWSVGKEDEGWVLYDGNGEVRYDQSGDIVSFDSKQEANAEIDAMFSEEIQRYPLQLEGLELETGGEWAENLYDKKMVNRANHLFGKKKWGKPKVFESTLSASDYEDIEFDVRVNGGKPSVSGASDLMSHQITAADKRLTDYLIEMKGEDIDTMLDSWMWVESSAGTVKRDFNLESDNVDFAIAQWLQKAQQADQRGQFKLEYRPVEQKAWFLPITKQMKEKIPGTESPTFDIQDVPVVGKGDRAAISMINNIMTGADGLMIEKDDYGTQAIAEGMGYKKEGNTYKFDERIPKNADIIAGMYQASWYVDLETKRSTEKLYRKVTKQPGLKPGDKVGDGEQGKDQVKLEKYLNQSWGTYREAADSTDKGDFLPVKNVLLRPKGVESGKGRQLLIQISSDFKSEGSSNIGDSYYEALYSKREGYLRPSNDFWELPEWMNRMTYFIPNADIYVIRNLKEAKLFLNQAGYDNVFFSVLDITKKFVKEVADVYTGKIIAGGYLPDGSYYKGMKNVTWVGDMEEAADKLGVEFKNGVDYKYFKNTKTIPRLEMSKGCLHKCAFCSQDRVLTLSSPEAIKQQLEAYKSFDYEIVYLNDKTFGQAKNYPDLVNIKDDIKKVNPNFKGFVIQTTATEYLKMDDDFLTSAGIVYLEIGVETFNDKMLELLSKPHREKHILEATAKARRLNQVFVPNVMVGLASKDKNGKIIVETEKTYARTLKYLNDNKDIISHVNIGVLAAESGTKLHAQLDATESDQDEFHTERSWLKNVDIHEKFFANLSAFGEAQLDSDEIARYVKESMAINVGGSAATIKEAATVQFKMLQSMMPDGIKLDALGEEGTTTPDGMMQVTVVDKDSPAFKATFNVKVGNTEAISRSVAQAIDKYLEVRKGLLGDLRGRMDQDIEEPSVEGDRNSMSFRYAYYGIFNLAAKAKGMKYVRNYLDRLEELNDLPVTDNLRKNIGSVAEKLYRDKKKYNAFKKVVKLRDEIATGKKVTNDPAVIKEMEKVGNVQPYTIRHTAPNYAIGQRMRYGKFLSSDALFDSDREVTRETELSFKNPITGNMESLIKQYDKDGNRLISGPIFSADRKTRLQEIKKIVIKNKKFSTWYERWKDFMFQFVSKDMPEIKIKRIAAISGILGAGKSPQTQQSIWAETINALETGHQPRKVAKNELDKIMEIWEGKKDEILSRTDDEGIKLIQDEFGRKIGPYLAASIDPSSPNVLVLDRHMPKGWGYNVLATAGSPQGGWNMHPSVEAEVKGDIYTVAADMDVTVAGVQAALWFDFRTPAADQSDIVKISQIEPSRYVPMVFHKKTEPAVTTGIHFKKTPMAEGEFVSGSSKKIKFNVYSSGDIGNRISSATKLWPYQPAVYMYQPGGKIEQQIRTGRKAYTFKYDPREIYDGVADPYDYWGTAQDELAKDPFASLTNIFLKLIKTRDQYKGAVVNSPYKNGEQWMMIFDTAEITDFPEITTVGISDMIDDIDTTYSDFEAATKDMEARGHYFGTFAKSVQSRIKYGELVLDRYFPSVSKFEGVTSGEVELGLGLKLDGPLRTQRAYLSEVGISRQQRQVYLAHEPRNASNYPSFTNFSEAKLFTFKAKDKYTEDIVKLSKDLEAAGLTDFNVILSPAGWPIIQQITFNDTGAAQMADILEKFADKGHPHNQVKDVHSETLGGETIEEALENYSSAIIDYWGEKKGREIIDAAIKEGEAFARSLRSGAYQKRIDDRGAGRKQGPDEGIGDHPDSWKPVDEDIQEPTKTVKAYKLFRTKKTEPGKIFPLFIGKTKPTEIGKWLSAEYLPTKGFALRPGWHVGVLPKADHLLRKDGTMDPSRVWAEVEIPDDVDWQARADKSKTKDIKGEAPSGGHYRFNRTAFQGGTWMIAGEIKINKILTNQDVNDILKKSKVEVQEDIEDKKEILKGSGKWKVKLEKFTKFMNENPGALTEDIIKSTGLSRYDVDQLDELIILQKIQEDIQEKPMKVENVEVSEVLDRIGRKPVGVIEKVKRSANYEKGSFTTATSDKLHPLKMFAGGESEAYMLHRGLPGIQSSINAMMEHGVLELDESGVLTTQTKNKGFIPWLRKLGKDGEKFFYWVIVKRDQSREKKDKQYTPMFTKEEREKLFSWTGNKSNSGKHWQEVNKEFQVFNDSILNLGIKTGLLDPAAVAQFRDQFYIPFYRIFEDAEATAEFIKAPVNTKKMISAQIKRLRGTRNQMGDPLENIMSNWSHLIKQSMTNQARKEAFNSINDSNVLTEMGEPAVEEVPWKDTVIFKPGGKRRNDYGGADTATFIYQKENIEVLGFKDNGKTRFFKVNDAELFNALSLQNASRLPKWLAIILGAPKALLTFGATITPSFVVSNTLRDTLHTYTISKGFIPFLSTAKGFYKTLIKDQDYVEYMASGNSFVGSYVKAENAEEFNKYTKKLIKREGRGVLTRILTSPAQIWNLWTTIIAASENAARLALYSSMKKSGATKLEASFAARDIMDFQKKGASAVVQYLTATVPFLNARIQGLAKMGQAAAANPGMYALKGATVAMASLALWAAYKDDDRYKELEAWEKFAYYHFWIGDKHFRIPKPFETGVIWSSAYTAAADVLTGNEEADHITTFIGAALLDTFAFNPIPQAAKPILEQYFNKNSFTGRPIEPESMKYKSPEDRYYPWDHESMIALGRALGVSPRRAQALVRGYLAGLGTGIMSGADIMVRQFGDFPVRPDSTIDSYPMVGRFIRSTPTKQTKYQTKFYDIFETLNQLNQTINIATRDGRYVEAAELRKLNQKKISAFGRGKVVKNRLSNIHKRTTNIWLSKTMDSKQKLEGLNKLSVERTKLVKEFYDWYLDNK